MNRIELLAANFQSVRRYTHMTLDGFNKDKWFCVPEGCPTHAAWQLGHIAIGNYGLALAIPRDESSEDEKLIPTTFREHFGRGSTPNSDPAANPSVEFILSVYNSVHDQIANELSSFTDEMLDETTPFDHPMFKSKFGSLMWSIQHEYTHAGQISLLYRLQGGTPRF